jgi:hypothetical protein
VAFYTDTEHRVEPVTQGIRIVLQYDVEVENWSDQKLEAQRKLDVHASKDADGDDDEYINEGTTESTLDGIGSVYRRRELFQRSAQISDSAINDIVTIIGRLLKDGQGEVAFALQYLYRKASILPEFLKGSDSLLYRALSKSFDVSLHPVVLHEMTDDDGRFNAKESVFRAYIFDSEDVASVQESHSGDTRSVRGKKKVPVTFQVPRSSAIEQISYDSYVESAGNEPMAGDCKYFGGGLFVRRRATGGA